MSKTYRILGRPAFNYMWLKRSDIHLAAALAGEVTLGPQWTTGVDEIAEVPEEHLRHLRLWASKKVDVTVVPVELCYELHVDAEREPEEQQKLLHLLWRRDDDGIKAWAASHPAPASPPALQVPETQEGAFATVFRGAVKPPDGMRDHPALADFYYLWRVDVTEEVIKVVTCAGEVTDMPEVAVWRQRGGHDGPALHTASCYLPADAKEEKCVAVPCNVAWAACTVYEDETGGRHYVVKLPPALRAAWLASYAPEPRKPAGPPALRELFNWAGRAGPPALRELLNWAGR